MLRVHGPALIPGPFQRFFKVGNYLPRQNNMNTEVRARIVDWLVEMQETFELNHETLYLGVKLFDMYLDRVDRVDADKLQLIGSAAMFIASKFDVRLLLSYSLTEFLNIYPVIYRSAAHRSSTTSSTCQTRATTVTR
jgi:Cyclin, N-terminal domain